MQVATRVQGCGKWWVQGRAEGELFAQEQVNDAGEPGLLSRWPNVGRLEREKLGQAWSMVDREQHIIASGSGILNHIPEF